MDLLNVHHNHLGQINTFSGALVDFHNPTPEMITTVDIAHALSKICRFGGHTKFFYSVAEHSALVAFLAPEDLALEALLHDASEAYLGDVVKPLKNILGKAYADIEDRFMQVIGTKYKLSTDKLAEVKHWDKKALELEHKAFIAGSFDMINEITQKVSISLKDKNYLDALPKCFAREINRTQYAKNITVWKT